MGVVPLIKAVQELSAENDKLKNRLEKIEALLANQLTTNSSEDLKATNSSINIYPNPGTGQIKLVSASIVDELKILNVTGQIISYRTPRKKEFSLEFGSPGIYFIQITSSGRMVVRKIIVYR